MLGILAMLLMVAPSVQWSAPEQACPGREAASEVIERAVGPNAEVSVEADVRAVDDGFSAGLTIRAGTGVTTRELESPDCDTLLEAISLIAEAAATDAREAEAAQDLEPEPEARPLLNAMPPAPRVAADGSDPPEVPPAVDRAADESAPRAPVAPPRRRVPIRGHVRPFGAVGWGVTPRVDAGGGVAVGLTRGALRLETVGLVVAPSLSAARDGARIRVWGWSVGLRGCGIVWTSARELVSIPVCGGADAGLLHGTGRGDGLARTSEHSDLWITASVGPSVIIAVARGIGVYAGVDAVVSARRPGFAISGPGTLYRPEYVGPRVALGIELHFPRRISDARGK